MSARYEKTIVLEEDGKPTAIVIYDEKSHTPVFYGVDKFGMDDILELLGGRSPVEGAEIPLTNPARKP